MGAIEKNKRPEWTSRIKRKAVRRRNALQRVWVEKKTLIFSLIVTYALAIILGLGCVFLQLDGARYIQETSSSIENDHIGNQSELVENKNNRSTGFVFYESKGLSKAQFIEAKLLEIIIPTTITFSGVIMCLQTDQERKRGWNVFLLLGIATLAIGGILLPTAKTLLYLNFYLISFNVISFLVVVASWNAYCIDEGARNTHKRESSDGKLVYGTW